MRYYKIVRDGHILLVGVGAGGTEITEAEYDTILSAIRSKPVREGYGCRLRADLTWEEYEQEPPDPDPEISEVELLDILMGGAE